MRQFEVIGGYDVMGYDVMGHDDDEVEGYGGPMGGYEGYASVVGYDDYGYPIVVGATPPQRRGRVRRGPARQSLVRVQQPGWRGGQLAPGVIAPDQGLNPLPMGTFTFTATAQTNTFQGQIQKPFRGERFLIRVVRTGTSAVGTLLGLIFVGTDLSQLDINPLDIESLANPTAFGVRLTMKPAQPGVFIRIVTSLGTALTGTDTINVSLQLLGRNIH